MKTILLFVAALTSVLLVGCACSPPVVDSGRKDGGADGGGGGSGASAYTYVTLDPSAMELKHIAMAVTADDRIGVAYFASVDGGVDAGLLNPNDAGTSGSTVLQNYEVRYVEFANGVASTPEVIRTVQLDYGVAVAFQGSGEPAVAFLGGGSDQSVYWLQGDAALAYRNGGTWTEQVAVKKSAEAPCGNALSDGVGFLVGINPAVIFDGATAYLAYRDCHNGQFPQQDWGASDLELAIGGPTGWQHPLPAICGGNNKQGFGAHINMVMANGQPAMVSDRVLGSASGTGSDVMFQMRNASGTWTVPISIQSNGNNQSGPSLAWDSTVGFGVAAVERSTNKLQYSASANGTTWNLPDPVFQTGSGGWYPSIAFDPIYHEPAIAFYICSDKSGVNEASCQPNEDSLHIRQLTGGTWQDQLVDEEGGYLPKIGFFSSGKRFVVYRVPATGAIRLAIEK